jgi:pilus assembly protein CpaF
MALMSDVDLPAAHVRAQVASAIDLVVHMTRLRDGRRVVFQIASVEDLADDGDPIVAEVFGFRPRLGPEGAFVATGLVPRLVRTLADAGQELPEEWFTAGVDDGEGPP